MIHRNRKINLVTQHNINWLRQFPNGKPQWGEFDFLFNSNLLDYDWLVVFDDINEKIVLKDGFKNTLHIATEPPTIVNYDEYFLRQFSYVVQIQSNLNHGGNISSPLGLNWHIGVSKKRELYYEDIDMLFNFPKKKLLSVITSNKSFTKEHKKRIEFVKKLKDYYGDNIDFYGRGFNDMDDKLVALKDYRFHVVIENSVYDNYFTEKITDCFLAGSFPLYHGCKNLENYFPKDSFCRIDINDFDKSISIIDSAISNNLDIKNYRFLESAKYKVLEKYNIFPLIVDLINKIEKGKYGSNVGKNLEKNKIFSYRSEIFKMKYSSSFKIRFKSYLKYIFNLKF